MNNSYKLNCHRDCYTIDNFKVKIPQRFPVELWTLDFTQHNFHLIVTTNVINALQKYSSFHINLKWMQIFPQFAIEIPDLMLQFSWSDSQAIGIIALHLIYLAITSSAHSQIALFDLKMSTFVVEVSICVPLTYSITLWCWMQSVANCTYVMLLFLLLFLLYTIYL